MAGDRNARSPAVCVARSGGLRNRPSCSQRVARRRPSAADERDGHYLPGTGHADFSRSLTMPLPRPQTRPVLILTPADPNADAPGASGLSMAEGLTSARGP
jgi:hypothetical protein